jgi:hypothetical protein
VPDRINPRDVERSQGDPMSRPDTGSGLREHIEQRRLPVNAHGALSVPGGATAPYVFAPPIPPSYAYQVYDARGTFVRTYLPEEGDLARSMARQLKGLLVPVQAEDYRDPAPAGEPRHS